MPASYCRSVREIFIWRKCATEIRWPVLPGETHTNTERTTMGNVKGVSGSPAAPPRVRDTATAAADLNVKEEAQPVSLTVDIVADSGSFDEAAPPRHASLRINPGDEGYAALLQFVKQAKAQSPSENGPASEPPKSAPALESVHRAIKASAGGNLDTSILTSAREAFSGMTVQERESALAEIKSGLAENGMAPVPQTASEQIGALFGMGSPYNQLDKELRRAAATLPLVEPEAKALQAKLEPLFNAIKGAGSLDRRDIRDLKDDFTAAIQSTESLAELNAAYREIHKVLRETEIDDGVGRRFANAFSFGLVDETAMEQLYDFLSETKNSEVSRLQRQSAKQGES